MDRLVTEITEDWGCVDSLVSFRFVSTQLALTPVFVLEPSLCRHDAFEWEHGVELG